MPGSASLRAMSRAVVLPTMGAMALLALLLGAILHHSTSQSDSLAIDRQRHLVAVAMRESIEALANDQEASTLWDDAVLRLRERPLDYEWIDNNLGVWFYTYYSHDQVYVLDPGNDVIYAMQAGARAPSSSFQSVSRQAGPLLSRVREQLKSGRMTSTGSDMGSAGASDRAIVAGRPAIVSVKPVLSETGAIYQQPGSEYLHISVRYLDGTFLDRLASDFGMDEPKFSSTHSGEASLPVTNYAGETLGYVTWSPFEPGEVVESRMMSAISIAVLLIGAFLGWLLYRIWHNRIDLETSRAQAQHLALHDPLTGLPNRALFEDRLAHALSQRRNSSPAVVLLDLDRFKNVNDTLGHQGGDELIRQFGDRLGALVREGDTVARLGGDEFAILVEGAADRDIPLFCERVLGIVRDPFDVFGSRAFVGVSLGVALSSTPAANASELTRKADIALYRSKETGRNRFTIFTEQMDASVRLRASIEEELRQALATGEGLRVHYQPQVGDCGRIVGLEALVRWEHPSRGLIAPGQFVPVAEESGLINALGEWVLSEACRVAVRWPDLLVSVNVSPVQFHSLDMADRFVAIVNQYGADPHRIRLEVPERLLLEQSDLVQSSLRALRSSGFQIVLDDFGTGYSAFGSAVDRIKIDQKFVRHLGKVEDSSPMIIAMSTLGKTMGLTVAAEGVETADQYNFLAAAGCTEMQGFLFSRPVAEEELEDLLRRFSSTPAAA